MDFSNKAAFTFLTIFIFFQSSSFAQAPDTLWTKTFGGVYVDVGHSVQETTDGGYIITGLINGLSPGYANVWLIKTDSSGDTLWTKSYGGNLEDYARSVKQTTNGGYIIAGNTQSFGAGLNDFWLIRTDASGDTLWTKTFGGTSYEECFSIQKTMDGGYILVGETFSFSAGLGDVWLIKTNASGDTLWTKIFGNSYWDGGRSVQQTLDGGYIIVGVINSIGGANGGDVWLIKTDSSGDTLWTKTYGRNLEDWGNSIKQTTDGGYIIAGCIDAFGAGFTSDIWLIKTDAYGDTLWTKIFGGSNFDVANSVQQTADGGYIITGLRDSYDGVSGGYVWLLRTDASGDTLWTKTYGGSGTNQDAGHSVHQTTDGGYIITGFTESGGAGNGDVWLIKLEPDPSSSNISVTSPNGGEVWIMNESVEITWTSENVDDVKIELSIDNGLSWTTIEDSITSLGTYTWVVNATASSAECLMKITDISNSTVYDVSDSVFTIEYPIYVDEELGENQPSNYKILQNFPNPYNASTIINFQIPEVSFVELKVFDVLGREMETLIAETKEAGYYSYNFDATEYKSGIYFYRIKAGNYIKTMKMILLK
jgi:hypothetical protein